LLSDDIAVIERIALLTARRIDGVRTTHERLERNDREREMSRLAAEAELRALRAQIHPHFLFNALTTIGYLIQTAPDRALATLMRLSGLLRSVLRSGPEFSTLGDELKIIAAYLDIEHARFEDRLTVRIEVDDDLKRFRIPTLLLQPLVENAIKHGISKSTAGGEIRITAELQAEASRPLLHVVVEDTGAGSDESAIAFGRKNGVGLNNIERRLQCYGDAMASLRISGKPDRGTRVEITLPAEVQESSTTAAEDRVGQFR
jgi:LytS/YehU family sensor histidine kinase